MGIQRRSQRSLKDVLDGQPGRGVPEKSTQSSIPPPPPSQPSQPHGTEPSDPKNRREPKDKGVVEDERSRPTHEAKDQRAAKQQKVTHRSQRETERATIQFPEPEAWLPAPMLGGQPLREDASIRDFNGGIGCQVASVLEETLLLPKDMAELRRLKRNEVFQNAKRYISMAVQATFRLEEITNSCYQQIDDEKKKRATAVHTLTVAEQTNVQLRKKLADEEHARKSTDSALEGAQKQAEDQRKLLRDANAQLATSKKQISSLQKQLEEAQRLKYHAEQAKAEAEKAKDAAEQHGYDVGVAETEENFRAEVPVVCRAYCALTLGEALDRAGVKASSELRRPESIYFPPAIQAPGPSVQPEEVTSTVTESAKETQTQVPPSLIQQKSAETLEVAKGVSLDKDLEGPKDGAASQGFEQALALTTLPAGEDPKAKEKDVPPVATSKTSQSKLQIKLNK